MQRLLESLANPDDTSPEGTLNLGALVPVQGGGGAVDTAFFLPPDSSPSTTPQHERTLAESTQ